MQTLLVSKVINKKKQWIAEPKDTIVVQLGDIIDGKQRNPELNENINEDEMKIVTLLNSLHNKAKKYNGAVYSLLGNHEYMNIQGDMSWVSQKGIDDFSGIKNRINAFKPESHISKMFAAKKIAILKIGSILFCHAGVLPHITKYSLDEINNTMRNYLLGHKLSEKQNNIKEVCFDSNDGILWTRYYGNEHVPQFQKCSILDRVLNNYKCNIMVVGHTPQMSGITPICTNKLWFTDIGMSYSIMNNTVEVLEILNDGVSLSTNSFKPFRILK